MSPIALGLDIFLITLLLVALAVGWRLNRRLQALRDGQAGFVKAVAELNGAAARAEAGLKALRAASEDAHDALLDRIETARSLSLKLEAATFEAQRVSAASPPVTAAQPSPGPMAKPNPRLAVVRPAAKGLDEELFEDAPRTTPVRRYGGIGR